MTNAFDRLSPGLRYHIANSFGFSELRPVQELTAHAILDGKNCVVLAPTAGGKTEAAFFPLLSRIDSDDLKPTSVLYLSPIRALLNNQEPRLQRYASALGRRAFVWHGDTTPAARKKFLSDPADLLLTTPESLEAMFMSSKVSPRALFANVGAVVIDEVHAFAAGDRGGHLMAILERLSAFTTADIQRVGLSATVGNPEEILTWLQGGSRRDATMVAPPRPKTPPDITLDQVGSLDGAATVVARLGVGEKRLAFVDSRRAAEGLGEKLTGAHVDAYVIHGSLAQSERRAAEHAFAEGRNCVIVATSALELGIDVGDLNRVLQIDAPGTVASFLQRVGRTGRRADTRANCTFLTTSDTQLLNAVALLSLHHRGFVESVRPSRANFALLAHQLLAASLGQGGVPSKSWFTPLAKATPFATVTPDDVASLEAHMQAEEILVLADGLLLIGPKGEKLYGRRNFGELFSVFSTPRLVAVYFGPQEIGTVDADFLSTLADGDRVPAFVLGGRAWRVTHVDWAKGRCEVTAADSARAPRWSGKPNHMTFALTQSMRSVLVDGADEASTGASWTARAKTAFENISAEYTFLAKTGLAVTESHDKITVWTFAGGRANLLLARLAEAELGGTATVRNTSITLTGNGARSGAAVHEWVRGLVANGRPSESDAFEFADACLGRARLSKFEPCLPDTLRRRALAEALDVNNARQVLRSALSGTTETAPAPSPR